MADEIPPIPFPFQFKSLVDRKLPLLGKRVQVNIETIPRGSILFLSNGGDHAIVDAIAIRANPANEQVGRYYYVQLLRDASNSIYEVAARSPERLQEDTTFGNIVRNYPRAIQNIDAVLETNRIINKGILKRHSLNINGFLDPPTDAAAEQLAQELDAFEEEVVGMEAEANAEEDEPMQVEQEEDATMQQEDEPMQVEQEEDAAMQQEEDAAMQQEEDTQSPVPMEQEREREKRPRSSTTQESPEERPSQIRALDPNENELQIVIDNVVEDAIENPEPPNPPLIETEVAEGTTEKKISDAVDATLPEGANEPEHQNEEVTEETNEEIVELAEEQIRHLPDGREAVFTAPRYKAALMGDKRNNGDDDDGLPDNVGQNPSFREQIRARSRRFRAEEQKATSPEEKLAERDEAQRKDLQSEQYEAAQEATVHGAFGNAGVIPSTSMHNIGSTNTTLEERVMETATPGGSSPGEGRTVQTLQQSTGSANPGIAAADREGQERGGPNTFQLHDAQTPSTGGGVSANQSAVTEKVLQRTLVQHETPEQRQRSTTQETVNTVSPNDAPADASRRLERDLFGAREPGEQEESRDDRILEALNTLIAQGRTQVNNRELIEAVQGLAASVNLLDATANALGDYLELLEARQLERNFNEKHGIRDPDANPPPEPIDLTQIVTNIYQETQHIGQVVQEAAQSQDRNIATENQRLQREIAEVRRMMGERFIQYQNEQRFNAVRQQEQMSQLIRMSERGNAQRSYRVREEVPQEQEEQAAFVHWLLRQLRAGGSLISTHMIALLAAGISSAANMVSANQIWWLLAGGVDAANFNFENVPIENGEYDLGAVIGDIVDQSGLQAVVEFPARNEALSIPNTYRGGDGLTDFQRSVDRASGKQRASGEINLPDPRFSERGGRLVPNTFERQKKNPKYDPRLKPGDKGYEPPYITEELPDVGLGAKDDGREREQAEADRIIATLPVRLYAPIHAQAVDRYLGRQNFARLGVPIVRYMKHFTNLQILPTDIKGLLEWNIVTMIAYGPMFYAFVTDQSMQRNLPTYSLENPEGVQREFMELYELLREYGIYVHAAPSRADRVADVAQSGTANTSQGTLSEQLQQYERDRAIRFAEQGFGPGAVVIQTDETGNAPPADEPDQPAVDPNQPDPPPLPPPTPQVEQQQRLSMDDIHFGIRRTGMKRKNTDQVPVELKKPSVEKDTVRQQSVIEERNRMFSMFKM